MPDASGFKAWTDAASKYGLNQTQIAGYFVKYLDGYAAYNSESKFVNALYQNVIGKPADPAVTKYLTDFMQAHSIGRDQVAVWFAEYEGNVAALAAHIDNGYWLV